MCGSYPILEMVVFHNLVALPFTLLFLALRGAVVCLPRKGLARNSCVGSSCAFPGPCAPCGRHHGRLRAGLTGLDVFHVTRPQPGAGLGGRPFEYFSLEYFSLPIDIMRGFATWREIPTLITLAGATLNLLSGLSILYLDRKAHKEATNTVAG